jgi:hypothetical protein
MRKSVNPLFLIGLLGTIVIGSQFAVQYGRALWGDRDIWWTPKAMALSLDETKRAFELYVCGIPLRAHLARGSLTAAEVGGKPHRVAPGDVTVRLNNWHKIQASLFHGAIPSAFLLGASITCLAAGLVQWRARRKESP